MAESNTQTLPYHRFQTNPNQDFYEGRYWNTNGFGVAIVAVVTRDIDWAAYIRADSGYNEQDCCRWAASHGVKLLEKDARYYFPEIKLPYRL